jgi:hypothetical protein
MFMYYLAIFSIIFTAIILALLISLCLYAVFGTQQKKRHRITNVRRWRP